MPRVNTKLIQTIFRRVRQRWFPDAKVSLRIEPEFFECRYQGKTLKEMQNQRVPKTHASYFGGVVSVFTPALRWSGIRWETLTRAEAIESMLIHELCHSKVSNTKAKHPRRFGRMYVGILKQRFNSKQIAEILDREMWSRQHGDLVMAWWLCKRWGLTR